MARHGLAEPLKETIPDIVAAMVGAHAQVMSAAELSIGLRATGVTRSDVREALWEDRTLVKTYGPRGTVHLLPARDLPLWTGALAAIPARSAMPGRAGLTPQQTDEVVAAVGGILADAELTVDELSDAVIAATGSWAGDLVMPAFGGYWPRWRQAIATAAHRGALCFGPDRGRKVTHTSPQRWLPGFAPADGDTALAWLVREYLRAYGPATPAHFARWLAAPTGWATSLFDSLSGDIERVDLDGVDAWAVAGDATFAAAEPVGVRLLPYFDPFVVGSHPRERLFPGGAGERALAGGQAGNYPVLLIDGVVTGVWHQRRAGTRIDITVEPLRSLTERERQALDAQVERVGAILEGRPRPAIGPVTVGPHA
jgi:hypothetical protein